MSRYQPSKEEIMASGVGMLLAQAHLGNEIARKLVAVVVECAPIVRNSTPETPTDGCARER